MKIRKDQRLIGVVVRKDQDQKIEETARNTGKTRSSVVQDLLDRYFCDVPDVEIDGPGLNHRK